MDSNPVNKTGPMHFMQDCILKSNDIQNNAFFAWHAHELNAIFSYHFLLMEETEQRVWLLAQLWQPRKSNMKSQCL
jgi:hypothetical protein